MPQEWISVLMGVLGLGLAVTLALLKIIYSSISARISRIEEAIEIRLRTLIHEDREIRSQMQGLTQLFFEALRHIDRKDK